MDYYIIRHNKELTDQAKKIFGDIVTKAYIVFYDFEKEGITPDTLAELDLIEPEIYTNPMNTVFQIVVGDNSILLEFINGNVVEFTGDSWATLGTADRGEMVLAPSVDIAIYKEKTKNERMDSSRDL